ncbi:hypothetical protein QF038_003107 [Pseudarthrobacter sp. W1I19]|uniref:hypothetical protein n=1 Tax=Pseudarthrobacter sp. W1I19 TaxID=3042288 RepID=UPI0027806114|nr:hypothetical protein [Pseudarthrobacter sp. W1I19]MDQ0924599.1 hypothetical protein [Pseudarthrobacter sp. W1I19]
MQFKPSAGIFVTGLVLSIIGTVFGFIGIGIAGSSRSYYSSGASAGGGFLAFLGFATALIGVVLIYVGASRALKIIDALPFVLNFNGQGQSSHIPAHQPATHQPSAQQIQQSPPAPKPQQQQPNARPQTPQHLVYNEPQGEQQPPVQ